MTNTTHPKTIKCDGWCDGSDIGTDGYLDEKGYAYCAECGPARQSTWGGPRCRKLRPHETNRLRKGLQITRY